MTNTLTLPGSARVERQAIVSPSLKDTFPMPGRSLKLGVRYDF